VTAYDLAKTLVVGLVLPPGGPLLLAMAGLLLMRRRQRVGATLIATGVLGLFVLAMPVVASALVDAFSSTQPLDLAAARQADAIIIPGGGLRRNAAEYGGDTLGRLSLERVRYGARLARELRLPVLVTGGRQRESTRTEAELMRDALQDEFAVPVKWVESQSRNTAENATLAARILLPSGVRKIVLVVHAFDVPRAAREYEAAGFEVVPAPTLLPGGNPVGPRSFLPNADALATSRFVAYEWLGLLARRLGV
jgi:uncharacterized SAM-binding protein YcdF (DUF218 family)